jgi:hypothetical protein
VLGPGRVGNLFFANLVSRTLGDCYEADRKARGDAWAFAATDLDRGSGAYWSTLVDLRKVTNLPWLPRL